MKHFWSVGPPILVLLTFGLIVLAGCSGEKVSSPETQSKFVLSGSTLKDGEPISATIIVASGDSVYQGSSGADGRFEIVLEHPPTSVVGVSLGFSGLSQVLFDDEDVRVDLQPIVPVQSVVAPSSMLSEYWFGVYDTDSHGDVRFRYRYNFSRFICINYLPNFPWADPNPNHWTSWDLNDFPYPWKGKKLLVPRTYQIWHRVAYGYSISFALYLIAYS